MVITHHKKLSDAYYLKNKDRMDYTNKNTPMDITCLTCGIHFNNVYEWWLHLDTVDGYHKVLHGYTRRGHPCIIEHFVTD